MRRIQGTLRAMLAALAVLGPAGDAASGGPKELVTPLLRIPTGERLHCSLVNADPKKTAVATILFRSTSGAVLYALGPNDVAPGASAGASFLGPGVFYCSFVVTGVKSGGVRASAQRVDGTSSATLAEVSAQ